MTHHLTDEQLGASRDGELRGRAADEAASHLAECAECRDRLAGLVALDAALAGALEHDPGEEYFASFADRVASRIAGAAAATSAGATAAGPPPARARGPLAWWNSPRRLAWAGGTIALVAVAALVTTLARDHGPQELAGRSERVHELAAPQTPPPAPLAQAAPETQAAPGTKTAPRPQAASPSAQGALVAKATLESREGGAGADARRPAPEPASPSAVERAPQRARAVSPAPVKRRDGPAGPQHVLEVRTLPNGEQEVVQHEPQFAPAPLPATQAPGRFAKPRAMPLGGRALGAAAPAQDKAERKLAQAPQAAAPMAALQNDQLAAGKPGEQAQMISSQKELVDEMEHTFCGWVRDSRGRGIEGAVVTLIESGGLVVAGFDGRFCIRVPTKGGTLSVLAVGYRAYRRHVAGAYGQDTITLAPVDVLGAPGAKPLRAAAPPSVVRGAALRALAVATSVGTVAAWSHAADLWEAVAATEGDGSETAYHVAECRVHAWLGGSTDAAHEPALRASALVAARHCLDLTPAGPVRDVAAGWLRALER